MIYSDTYATSVVVLQRSIQANTSEVEFDRDWQDLKSNEMFMKRPKITN